MNVRTRIGGTVFYLLSKYFPQGSKYHHVFNKNTVKVSYCCLPNMDTIIKGMNKKVLSNTEPKNGKERSESKNCNTQGVCEKGCRAKGKCETSSVVYKATVHVNDKTYYKKVYVGMTEGKLKNRISKHYSDFKYISRKNSTSFTTFIWKLQNENKTFQIEWDILEQSIPYKKGDRFCHLCINEKEWIAKMDTTTRINSSDEYVSKCPHKRKFKLGRIQNTESIDLMKHTIVPDTDIAPDQNQEINIIIPRKRPREKTRTVDESEGVT